MNLGSASRPFLLFSALVAAASSFGCAQGSTLTPNGGSGEGAAGGSGTSNTGGAGGSTDTTVTTTSSTSTTSSTFTNSTTSSTTTFTNTTTSLGGTCDNTGNCQTCATCAQNDTCILETTICVIDPECLDFETCVQACAQNDQACIDNCIALYPNGYHLLMRDLSREIVWTDVLAFIGDRTAPLPSGYEFARQAFIEGKVWSDMARKTAQHGSAPARN